MGKERVDNTFKVAHVIGCVMSDEVDDIRFNLKTFLIAFSLEDFSAQLIVRTFDFANETPLETCQKAWNQVFKLNRRAVAGHDELFARLVQIIKNMEECILSSDFSFTCKLLNIVNDKHIDTLVEIDEVIDKISTNSIDILHLEDVACDI